MGRVTVLRVRETVCVIESEGVYDSEACSDDQ